jgi:hypothetical protein
MPNGTTMSPENLSNRPDKFSIGAVVDTNIGTPQEHMDKFINPEKAPVNLLGGDAEQEKLDLERLFASERMVNPTAAGRFVDKLRRYDTEGDEESLRGAERAYSQMFSECLSAVDEIFVKNVDQKKNAYPYDHRQAEYAIELVKKTVSTLGERRTDSVQRKILLKDALKDVAWMEGFLRTTVTQTAGLPYYYDVVQQLQVLKQGNYRAFSTAESFEKTFGLEMPGMELSDSHHEIKQSHKVGIYVPKEYKKDVGSLVGPKETLSVREIAIRLQDDSFEARMKLAAVSQADFLADKPEETTFMGRNLTKQEFEFYKKLFWWKDPNKNEGQIMSPYITANEDHVREISTKLEALVLSNAVERIKDIGPNNLTQIDELADEVSLLAKEREDVWHSRDKTDIVSQLAVLITKQGLLQDYAFMHASEYCWEYTWNTDNNGNIISKRGTDTGGIYTPTGDIASLFWARRQLSYDSAGNSAATLLLASNREQRTEEIRLLPPSEMPKCNIESEDHPDKYLKQWWNFLFSDDSASEELRKKLGYSKMNSEVAVKLKKWAWSWKVPWPSTLLGETEEYDLEVPHFMPPKLDIANFFKSISTEGKLNNGDRSVWTQLIEGDKLSDIEWTKMGNNQHDRWLVDLDMASRFMRLFIEPADPQKDPIMAVFSGDASTFAPKELAKRLRLAFRDSNEGKPTEYEIALIPLVTVLAVAKKHGIFGPAAFEINTKEDKELNSSPVERFLADMAYWKRALKWMAKDRPVKDGIKDMEYGNDLAMVAEFYEAIILRTAKASAEEAYVLANDNYGRTADNLMSMKANFGGEYASFTVPKKKSLEK